MDPATPLVAPEEWSGSFDLQPWSDEVDAVEDDVPVDDHVDTERLNRFHGLPPITPEDITAVDMDGLLARLVEDPYPGGRSD